MNAIRKALIVEDHRPLAEALSRLLSRRMAAEVCGDGVEALKKYAAEPYDLLVIDLHLPRLNGAEVIRKIRATHRGKNLPIIISTGVYKGEQNAKKAQAAFGVKHYLEKPFSQESFMAAVNDLLGEEGPSAEPAEPVAVQSVRASPGTERTAPAPADQDDKKPPTPAVPEKLAEIKPRPAVRGSVARAELEVMLLEARDRRATGLLFVKKADDERTIVFLNGMPVGLRTTRLESSLGASLFNQGRISLMEYQVYQGRFKNGPDPDEVLVKMGALSPSEFYEAFRRHLEESLIQLFEWEDGEFTFQFWRPLPEGSPRPQLNLAHIIHQGFRRHLREDRRQALMQRAAGRFPALAPAYYDHQMHLAIDPAEALFLDRIDGATPFEDLLPEEPEEREKMVRSLGAFLSLGMVELRERPAESMPEAPFPIRERDLDRPAAETGEEEEEESEPTAAPAAEPAGAPSVSFDDVLGDLEDTLGDVVEEFRQQEPAPAAPSAAAAESQQQREEELKEFIQSARTKNFYEILEMKANRFDFNKMKETYFRLTKKFSPENFIMSSGDLLKQSEDALAILASAYNTLSNVVSKEKYDEMISSKGAAGVPGAKDHDKMQAEVAFQSGMAFMEMDDWEGAEKSLAEAMSLAGNNADIIANYAYALYNKNRKSKTIQRRVHELIQQALKIKPRCAFAFAYRGVILLDEDKLSLAEADFKKALSINPRYKFALKGMRMIEQKKQSEKKGLFGRFRK